MKKGKEESTTTELQQTAEEIYNAILNKSNKKKFKGKKLNISEYEYKKNKWKKLVENNKTAMDELELQDVYYASLMEDYENGILTDEPVLLNYGDLAKNIMKDLSEIEIEYAKNLPENIKNSLEKRLQWLNNPPDSTFYDANNRIEDAKEKFKRQREYFELCKPLFVNETIVEKIWIKLNKISTTTTDKFLKYLFYLFEISYLKSKDHPLINDRELNNYAKIENKLKLLEKVIDEAEKNESILFYTCYKDYKKLLKAVMDFRKALSKPLNILSYDINSLINDRGSKNGSGKAIYFIRKIRQFFKKYYNRKLNKITSLIIDNIFEVYYSENEITKFCNKR